MKALRFGYMGGPSDGDDFARAAEDHGADLLGYGESPSQFADPYVRMATAARVTSRIHMGTVVSCPGLRHPVVHANTLQTLQQLSNGRIFAGIGTGDLALIEIGQKPFKMDDFIGYATTVRELVSGRAIDLDGHPVKLPESSAGPVPILFGADGPRRLSAAGECADGAILAQVGSPDVVRTAIDRATKGAVAAGRDPAEVDLWFMLRVVPTDKEDGATQIDGLDEYATRALRFMWRTAGTTTRETFADTLLRQRGYRIDPDVADRLYEFNLRWDQAKAFNSKHHVHLMDELELRGFASRYFFISGPEDLIIERVRALIDAGARNFLTPLMVGDKLDYLRRTAAVLNKLR